MSTRTDAGPAAAASSRQRSDDRPTLAVIGAGRCGTALATAAVAAGYRVVAVASRTPENAARLAERVGAEAVGTPLAAVRRAAVSFLTVPDSAITAVAASVAASGMALRGHALVHCSGAQGSRALAASRQLAAEVGAVHPLMALVDAESATSLGGTFFAIEADGTLRPLLERLVRDVGGIPFAAPAGDRALYHAAAALVGNAPLALLDRAVALLERAGVDAAVAGPALATLLEGAARNARRLGARSALTGPVVRDDATTVRRHLDALRGDQPSLRLYHRMARETLATAGLIGREDVAAVLAAPARPVRVAPAATPAQRTRRPARSRLGLGSAPAA